MYVRVIGPTQVGSFEHLAHFENMASLNLFYRYYFGRYSLEFTGLIPNSYPYERYTLYFDRLLLFGSGIFCLQNVSLQFVIEMAATLR